MTITRITKENELRFNYLFPKESQGTEPNLIRIGVINDEGKGVGTLSARVDGNIVTIISVFVLADYRRQGYGRALFEWLQNTLLDQDIDFFETEFFSDTPSEAFAEAMGFDLFETRPLYSFSLGEVFRSPLYKKHIAGKPVKKIKAVSDLSIRERKIFEMQMGKRGYDPDWTTAGITDGQCTSSLLVTRWGSQVSLVMINSTSPDVREVLYHIRAVIFKTMKEYPDRRDIEFRLTILDPKRVKNLAGLLGGQGHVHKAGYFRHAVKMLT